MQAFIIFFVLACYVAIMAMAVIVFPFAGFGAIVICALAVLGGMFCAMAISCVLEA